MRIMDAFSLFFDTFAAGDAPSTRHHPHLPRPPVANTLGHAPPRLPEFIPRARLMIEELLANNEQLLDLLNQCFATAEQENQQGIANFIAERIDAQQKHGWMLRSFLKDERA